MPKAPTKLEAYNSEDFGVYISFTITVDTSPPKVTGLKKISGDNQTGFTGEPLANPFVVQVRDQFDDPLEGTIGDLYAHNRRRRYIERGPPRPPTQTDSAESTLTLGPDPGTNTVEASVNGISQTEIFNAEATRPPPAPTTLSSHLRREEQDRIDRRNLDGPGRCVQVHRPSMGTHSKTLPVTFTIR